MQYVPGVALCHTIAVAMCTVDWHSFILLKTCILKFAFLVVLNLTLGRSLCRIPTNS